MRTFRFFGAVCLIVLASLLLETDASPKPKIKGKNGASRLTLQNQRDVDAHDTGNSDSTTPAPPIKYTWKNKDGLTLQNQWDGNALGMGLTLYDKLTVEYTEGNYGYYSVLAKQPIPTGKVGVFYFEVKVIRSEGYVSIGLGKKSMPLNEWPGHYKGTYAYGQSEFWGHNVAGCSYNRNNRRPYIGGRLAFTEGDVVGCGVNLETGEIIYTKNGKRLDTGGLLVSSTADLFPSVWMYGPGTKIEANFGPTFLCNEKAPGQ